AEVDEHQATEVAPGVHPTVQNDGLSDVVSRQFPAGMRSFVQHVSAIGRQVDPSDWLRPITIPLSDENRQAIEDSDTAPSRGVRRSEPASSVMIERIPMGSGSGVSNGG